MKCRGYQFEVGKTYEIDGKPVKCAENGFHACEYPLDIFNYYTPSESRFCEVEALGDIDKGNDDDSKVATSKIKVGLEIGLKGIIEASIKFVFDKADWENKKETNTGNSSVATNTGNSSVAIVTNKKSIACGLGIDNKAKGILGSWLVLSEWIYKNQEWNIKTVKTILVDGVSILENTFYELKEGNFVKSENQGE